MAKKVTKSGAAAARRARTGRTTTGSTVRRAAPTGAVGAGASRPGEPELDRLTREKEESLARGETQPHPENAARMGRTSTVDPPTGRAHVNRQTDLPSAGGKGTIRVRALSLGYYNHVRRREGDVFTLIPLPNGVKEVAVLDKDGEPKEDRFGRLLTKREVGPVTAEDQFSELWMERVSDDHPEKVTTGAEALKAHHDEVLASRMTARGTGSSDVI